MTREFRSSQNLQGIVEGQVADRPPVAPGDKTSRRLQSTLAEAFKPLETFDCPGTVSLIGFNLKSFTQIAKRCIFSTKLISSRCYRCWWFHVSYFHHQRIIWAPIMTLSFFFGRSSLVGHGFMFLYSNFRGCQRPLRNASSQSLASTIAFVIALAVKTRIKIWGPKRYHHVHGAGC